MSAEMTPQTWVDFVSREYLGDFIAAGGSAVKFVVPSDSLSRTDLTRGLADAATEQGYVCASVSAARTKIHMVDHLFFEVAATVDWSALARGVLARIASASGYKVPDGSGSFLATLAAENDMDEDFLRTEMRREVSRKVFRRPSLARDFRVAMSQLCLAELASDAEKAVTYALFTEWLTGATRTVGALKSYQIFTKINRTNARAMLESLQDWIRYAGLTGLVVVVDAERLTLAKRPTDGSLHYTKMARLDAYEVFRQFIDATDRAQGFMLVVVPGADFLDPSPTSKGLGEYQALKFRVYDEVRDLQLVNPMAALARISTTAQEVSAR